MILSETDFRILLMLLDADGHTEERQNLEEHDRALRTELAAARIEDMPNLLNAEDVAGILRLTKKTIYDYVADRRIPFVKIGKRCVRFKLSEINGWIKDREQTVKGEKC